MSEKIDLTKEINKAVEKCLKRLVELPEILTIKFCGNKFPGGHFGEDDLIGIKNIAKNDMVKALNKNDIAKIVGDGANIYALWVREPGKDWQVRYIGQRKSAEIIGRVNQHLFRKHEKTGSQLHNVTEEVNKGNEIGLSVVLVYPDELRSTIEEQLIKKTNPAWNKHGRKLG